MGNAALVSILISILLYGVETINLFVGEMNDTTYIPYSLGITLSSLQVFFPLLAIVFSLVSFFKNKKTTIFQSFLLLAVSSTMFFINLYWLISWFTDKN